MPSAADDEIDNSLEKDRFEPDHTSQSRRTPTPAHTPLSHSTSPSRDNGVHIEGDAGAANTQERATSSKDVDHDNQKASDSSSQGQEADPWKSLRDTYPV